MVRLRVDVVLWFTAHVVVGSVLCWDLQRMVGPDVDVCSGVQRKG